MTIFTYQVNIDTDSLEHAEIALCERLGYDEQYEDEDGNEFDYQITSYVVVPPGPPIPTVQHMYDGEDLLVWSGDTLIRSTDTHVYVYKGEESQLRFASADPQRSVRILANLIFNTNKEYAS